VINKLLAFFLSLFLINQEGVAQTANTRQIGKSNMLFDMSFAFFTNGTLYTLDNTGALFRSSLDSGNHSRIGNAVFKNARFFFGFSNRLYIIETDGSMDQIDPLTGNWSVASSIGTWSLIDKAFVVKNSFFAVENGTLFYYPLLNPRLRKQRGEAEFYNIGLLLRGDTSLHSLIGDGSLYEINADMGTWKKIFKNKAFKNSKTGAILNNKFYSSEGSGGLFETSLPDGARKQLDAIQFQNAKLLFANLGKLYAVNIDGTLYEIILN
jgi:hypothetical protein